MKKILFTTVLASLLFFSDAFAQSSLETTFSVINISQENKDAQVVGAREGDVLRYEFLVKSPSEPVSDYSVSVETSKLQALAEVIDTGLGELSGADLVFPTFSQAAPCEKVFTFFARVKPCNGGESSISTEANGKTTLVPLHCGLAKSGPSRGVWIVLIASIMGVFMLFNYRRS